VTPAPPTAPPGDSDAPDEPDAADAATTPSPTSNPMAPGNVPPLSGPPGLTPEEIAAIIAGIGPNGQISGGGSVIGI
jgi:hypothetical protein